jgi:WD40 repeat protein
MDLEQAIALTNQLVYRQVGRYLSDLEQIIFIGAWRNQTYEQIADAQGYSVKYLKDDSGRKLWKLLTQAFNQSVNKTNFRSIIERRFTTEQQASTQPSSQLSSQPSSQSSSQPFSQPSSQLSSPLSEQPRSPLTTLQPATIDWGETIDVSTFYGRSPELTTLTEWINRDRCRLIAILGMGGIGKTALSVKLSQGLIQVEPGESEVSTLGQFNFVIWRSLRNAPPLEVLLTDLVSFLSRQQATQADLQSLMEHLRSHRCLVVLDNLESILQGSDRAGQFRSGYENYEELLRLVSESNHQSCLVLTSREKPAIVAAYEGVDLLVRSLPLTGSKQAAQGILQAKGLVGSEAQSVLLGDRYGNSPLALKIVATSIQDLYDGAIDAFMQEDTFIFNGVRRLFDQQFSRLSQVEQSILYWLAINREWTTVTELYEDISPAVSRASLLESLESLSWRSLIERQAGAYTQQPVVMEYVIDRLVEQIVAELETLHLSLFLNYALIKTTAKDYVREAQQRLLLGVIGDRFRDAFRAPTAQSQQVAKILDALRQPAVKLSNYGAGNLINLCTLLELDLTGADFSELNVCHAYLQNRQLHRVNLTRANLHKSVFTQTFGNVLAVAFSPNGQLLATGDTLGDVQLWQVADGQKYLTCQGHTNRVWSVVFSPDGTCLASSSDDCTIKLWSLEHQSLKHQSFEPQSFDHGTCLNTLQGHTDWVHTLAFSPDGTRLVSGSDDYTVKIWRLSSGTCLQTLDGHSSWVQSVAFSGDGRWIASGSDDQTIKLWDAQSGVCLQTLQGHHSWIQTVKFSPDSQILASGGGDGLTKLWDVQTGTCIRTIAAHTQQIWAIAFHPNQPILATGSGDQRVKLWNIHTGDCFRTLQAHTSAVWAIAFNPDSNPDSNSNNELDNTILASGSQDQTVRLWNIETGHCLKTLQGHSGQVWSVAFSPTSDLLATASHDRTIRIWHSRTGACLKTLQGHTSWVQAVAFDPEGQRIASGSDDQTAKIWDVSTGQCITTLKGHRSWIWSVAFSPDGQTLVTSSHDRTNQLWNLQSNQPEKTLPGYTDWIRNIVFSPNGQALVSRINEDKILLWDAHTGESLQTLSGHRDQVWFVTFSPDGSMLASGSADQTIKLWDVNTGTCVKTLVGHTSHVWSVAFSPNGQQLVSGGSDRTVRLWDVTTGTLQYPRTVQHQLSDHSRPVRSVAFNAAGTLVASGSEDETVKLWEVRTGICVQTLRSDRPYEGINITDVTGITAAQKATLKALGAIDERSSFPG